MNLRFPPNELAFETTDDAVLPITLSEIDCDPAKSSMPMAYPCVAKPSALTIIRRQNL